MKAYWWLPVLFFYCAKVQASGECAARFYDDRATLKAVIDADRLLLSTGTEIKLIGVSAMGLDEALQAQAKAKILKLVDGQPLQLAYDKTFINADNQVLAHVYTRQDISLQAELLSKGLLRQTMIDANDYFWRCYQQQEAFARESQQGLWQLKANQPLLPSQLTHSFKSYRDILGKVTSSFSDDSGFYLIVEGRLYLAISEPVLARLKRYYPTDDDWRGMTVLVRGKTYFAKDNWQMTIDHPWQFILQATNQPTD